MKKIMIVLMLVATSLAHAQNKNYITRVFDYLPAPGQFVNVSPACNVGEPRDSVLARVLKSIGPKIEVLIDYDDDDNPFVVDSIIKPVTGELISLGSFGGYVIFGFDHPLVNVKGERDLQIFGNGFGSDSLALAGGSSEPGIVMVGVDSDGDGVPSQGDHWYELAGSEYGHAKTQHNFEITYYRPDEDVDTPHVRWTCNSVDSLQEGYVHINTFHTQPYWPLWIDQDKLTFKGTKLRCTANDVNGNGSYYLQYFFDWGYVDNRTDYDYGIGYKPAETLAEATGKGYNLGFDLDWAVDEQGRHVELMKADFIKVYSALLQECGWLGETSTEVCGAIDLHPDAPLPDVPQVVGDVNGDKSVDVSDVNIVINIMLGKASASGYPNANVDGQDGIDVGDVNMVINIMLGKQ